MSGSVEVTGGTSISWWHHLNNDIVSIMLYSQLCKVLCSPLETFTGEGSMVPQSLLYYTQTSDSQSRRAILGSAFAPPQLPS
eukprot:scaffold67500_cov70-Cyclotella_meneghiniana.AAC.4